MKKKLLIVFIGIAVVAVSAYLYVYKGHRDIATESADFTITVADLQKEYSANATSAYTKYQNKTIQISGKLTSIDLENKAIMIDEKLYATFLKEVPKEATVGKEIKVKGRFLDYDDLVEEFKMDQTMIVE